MAKTDYNPAATIDPTGPSGAYLRPDAPAGAFGAQIGAATEKLGGTFQQSGNEVNDLALKYQGMQNDTLVNNALTTFGSHLGDQEMNLHSMKGEGATAAFGSFKTDLTSKMNEIAETIQSPLAKRQFLDSASKNLEYTMRSAGAYVGNQAEEAHINSITGRIANENNLATLHYQDPAAINHSIENTVNHTLDLAHAKGLDQDSANALVSHNVGNLLHSVIMQTATQGVTPAQQADSLAKAQKLFDQWSKQTVPGSPDVPAIDANHRDQLTQMLQSRQYTNEIRQQTAENHDFMQQQKYEKEASEKAANGYITRILKGDTTNMTGQIADDPHLKPQEKWSVYQMMQAHDKREDGAETATYGSGFWDAYKQVHLPDDDPNKLTDPKQLYSRAGPDGDLTLHGVDRLIQEIAGKKTPDGEAEATMRAQFLKNAKAQISGQNDAFSIKDSKGEEQFLKFMGNFFPAYAKGKADGKTAAQLLNPDSPDYLGKNLQTFVRPADQRLADMMYDQNAGVAAPGKKIKAADLARMDRTALLKAVQADPSLQDQGYAIALKNGWVPKKVTVPTE